ncbi:hypothetical protein ACIO6T_37210 [Streptomyces sp. NPDC087532]|uniref:hypothetical protein n=1 Tax=Streptomyces sp. NPDC087532 TaxID=3365795 RepID=UPI0038158DDA
MTILIDTKNEMKKSIDGLDGRVSELDRELRAVFTGEIDKLTENGLAELKTSQQETRTSAYNAGKRASDAVTAVTDLRRHVDHLHNGLESLHRDVQEALSLLRAAAPVAVAVGAAGEPVREVDGTVDGPELAGPSSLPRQRQTLTEETEPALSDAPAAAEEDGDDRVVPEEPGKPAELGEPEETEQAGPEAGDRAHGEGQHDVPRAALEASEQGSGASVGEPSPLTWKGRIWAIMRAGRVASATLICHRDTWEFVAAQVGSHPHFRTPALEERENGLVAAVLSGRSLVAMLLALYRVANASVSMPDGEDTEELVAYADWAMASQVYYATARVLSRSYSGEGEPVVVTIDNRVPAQA